MAAVKAKEKEMKEEKETERQVGYGSAGARLAGEKRRANCAATEEDHGA